MPLPIIPLPEFPNVPFLPGVPQVARISLFFPPTIVSIGVPTIQSQLWSAASVSTKWGIFDQNNNQVLDPDNVLALDNRNEWRLSNYPIQRGSFSSYNKVVVPFEVAVKFTKGGSEGDRSAFIEQIDAIAGDLNLYTILTPEKSYLDCNIHRYEITRRGSEGAYYLADVDVFFTQILQVDAQYSTTATNTSNAQDAAAVPPVNQGNQQPQTVPPEISKIALVAIDQQFN